jgi:hypothetical protein
MGSNQFNKLGVKNISSTGNSSSSGNNLHTSPKNGVEYVNTPKLVELLINYEIG